MADPDSELCARRGVEEQLFDAIPARVRMALSYYAPLADVPGVNFRLQSETLYNSIFNGYMAPSSTCVAWTAATSSTCTSAASTACGRYSRLSGSRGSGDSGPVP